VRAALISISGQPRKAGQDAPATLAGKTLARRQLDFALAAGCERIVALGEGGGAEAIALRHAAEAAGARFLAIRDGHGLLGTVRAADELLVLAPGLVAEDTEVLQTLAKGTCVLVLPAGLGVPAGFERIDLERAWAGALVLPGGLVERLAALPPDSEPAAALLRVALQAHVSERRMPEEPLVQGSWSMVGANDDAARREREWLRRNLPPAPAPSLSQRLSRVALRWLGVRLLPPPRVVPALAAGTVLLLAGAVAAAAYGLPALGLALVALGALLGDFANGLSRLRAAPFGRLRRRRDWWRVVPWLVDAALAIGTVLAIEGAWAHRLFPPLVLLGALHGLDATRRPNVSAVLGDRAILAAAFAAAAAFGLAQPAVMLAGLAVIALNAANLRPKRG
jgi:hypothetical protein